MKNILKYSFIFGTAVLLVATSCIKEVLPTGSGISKEQALSSPNGTEAMVNAIATYAANSSWDGFYYTFGYPSLCLIRESWSNDMAGSAPDYDWFSMFSENIYQNGVYAQLQIIWMMQTKLVALSNDVIRMIPNVEEVKGTPNQYNLGIAHAYRALLWLDMGRMYEFKANKYTSKPEIEGLTIPYLHENMTEDFARNNPRLTKAELIKHIKESLEIAIDLLDGYAPATKTIPTQAVAYGLLARTLMWEADGAENPAAIYLKAKEAAENALSAGAFSPLTKTQWTDTATGFNSASSQESWMLCTTTNSESSVVKSADGMQNITSWMASETSFGFAGYYSSYRLCDAKFYNQIPDTDFRKLSWKAPNGSSLNVPYIPASGNYKGPNGITDLACVKFRPGQGNPNNYLISASVDFPLMRMEEMKFIIAECDARAGSAASLIDIVKTRNPEYTTSLTGNSLIREVLFQKRIEFWGEGIMFFDYKRCPDLLQIERGYEGTNHPENARFNCDGLAPWMNVCINEYEAADNPILLKTNNPDPSGTVPLWQE